jgi:O-antigen/teichoic acid export membrane protein
MVVDLSIGALGQVALPTLSPLQDDHRAFGAKSMEMIKHGSMISVGLLAVVAAGSLPLTRVLGSEWHDAWPTMPILALAAAFTSMSALITPTLQASGRAGLSAARSWALTLVNVGLLLTAAQLAAGRSTQTELIVLACTRLLLGIGQWGVVDSYLFRRFAFIPLSRYYGNGVVRLAVGISAAALGTAAAYAVGPNPWISGIVCGVVVVPAVLIGLSLTDHEARSMIRRTTSRVLDIVR